MAQISGFICFINKSCAYFAKGWLSNHLCFSSLLLHWRTEEPKLKVGVEGWVRLLLLFTYSFRIFFPQHKSLFISLVVSDGGWSSEERKHLLLRKTESGSKGTTKQSQVAKVKLEPKHYLSPGVPSVGRDENADVGVGKLCSDYTWIQRRSKAPNPNYFKRQNKSTQLCGNFIPQTKSEDGDRRGTAAEESWFDFILWAGNNSNVTGLTGRADGCDEGRTTDWASQKKSLREKKIKDVDAHLMLLWFREPSLCWQCFLKCKDSPTRAGAGAGNSGAGRHEGDPITQDLNHQDCFPTLFTSNPIIPEDLIVLG